MRNKLIQWIIRFTILMIWIQKYILLNKNIICLLKKTHSNISEVDSEQYQRGYQNAMDDFQRNLKLKSRDVTINIGRANANQPSSSQNKIEKQKEKQK